MIARLCFLLLAQLTAFTIPCFAANVTWTGAQNANWSNSQNWNPAQVPTSSDRAYVQNGRTATFSTTSSRVQDPRIGYASSSNGTVFREYGYLMMDRLYAGTGVGSYGQYSGYGSVIVFNEGYVGGLNNENSAGAVGALNLSATVNTSAYVEVRGFLYVGAGMSGLAGTGTISLTDSAARLVTSQFYLGHQYGGAGTLNIQAGTVTVGSAAVANSLEVGCFGTGTAEVGGSSRVTIFGDLVIGNSLGLGTLNITSSTNTIQAARKVILGDHGRLNITADSATITLNGSASTFTITSGASADAFDLSKLALVFNKEDGTAGDAKLCEAAGADDGKDSANFDATHFTLYGLTVGRRDATGRITLSVADMEDNQRDLNEAFYVTNLTIEARAAFNVPAPLYYMHVYLGDATMPTNDSIGPRRLIPGDANLDGTVDVLDLGIVSTNWQLTGMTWAQGDFNGDGVVDVLDLGIVSTYWQQSSVAPGGEEDSLTTATIPSRDELEASLRDLNIPDDTIEEVLDAFLMSTE